MGTKPEEEPRRDSETIEPKTYQNRATNTAEYAALNAPCLLPVLEVHL